MQEALFVTILRQSTMVLNCKLQFANVFIDALRTMLSQLPKGLSYMSYINIISIHKLEACTELSRDAPQSVQVWTTLCSKFSVGVLSCNYTLDINAALCQNPTDVSTCFQLSLGPHDPLAVSWSYDTCTLIPGHQGLTLFTTSIPKITLSIHKQQQTNLG